MTDIFELNQFYYDNFSQCLDTLENCSYDSVNNTKFCTLKNQCYNFDKIKKIACFERYTFCSVDSLIISTQKNIVYFIEFKNAKFKNSKDNFANSSEDSFLVYKYLETFCKNNSISQPILKSILVLEEIKNSTFLYSLKAAKLSNKLDENLAYEKLKEHLVKKSMFGQLILFDEIIICSQNDLLNIIK